MKFTPQSPQVMLCLFFSITIFFSCSKDSDLMADYVALDPEIGTIAKFVANDIYQISISSNSEEETYEITVNSGSSGTENNGSSGTTVNDTYQTSSSANIVLDVLANDTFTNKEAVVISETSQPNNGEVVINTDNTLTYTPSSVEASENTFTYTAEFVTEAGTISSETGTVSIEINPPSSLREGQVNFSDYGAIGDGVTDDTKALQDAFDSGDNLISDASKTYKITSQLDIDKSGDQIIDFNGSTVTVTSNSSFYAFKIEKQDRATTTMFDLLLDGNELLRNGFDINSPIDATNVDIIDLYDADNSVIGWRIDIENSGWSYGTYNFDGCDLTNIHSLSNGATGDARGSARAVDLSWEFNPPSTTVVTFENFMWDGFYGEDGGPIRVDDNAGGVEFSNTAHKTILRSGTIKNFIRRGIKIGCDNIEAYNVNWISINTSNSKYENNPAGLIGIRPTGNDPNGSLNNLVFNGCTFEQTNSYPWMILDKMDGVMITNCEFKNGAGIRIDNLSDSFIGDWTICNSTFSAGSVIKDQNQGSGAGSGQLTGTTLNYDTGNNRTEASIITFDATNVETPYTYSAETVGDCPSN